jgi:CheY-like chemotaxis protein
MEVSSDKMPRILVVEDHQDSRDAMAKLLRFSGYRVSTAGSVAEALRAAEGDGIDLLVCDLTLPDGSGWELKRELCSRHPIPAIAVTGHSAGAELHEAERAGFRDRLLKPIDLPLLLSAIENATGAPALPMSADPGPPPPAGG